MSDAKCIINKILYFANIHNVQCVPMSLGTHN